MPSVSCLPPALQHLRRIRNSTRAEVHVDAKLDGVPERVVVCKSQEPADSQWCGAAEALMKCTQHMLHDKVRRPAPRKGCPKKALGTCGDDVGWDTGSMRWETGSKEDGRVLHELARVHSLSEEGRTWWSCMVSSPLLGCCSLLYTYACGQQLHASAHVCVTSCLLLLTAKERECNNEGWVPWCWAVAIRVRGSKG